MIAQCLRIEDGGNWHMQIIGPAARHTRVPPLVRACVVYGYRMVDDVTHALGTRLEQSTQARILDRSQSNM